MTIETNVVYRIKGFSVHASLRQVTTGEQTISVRPKTFALLLAFLENPLQILSKDLLLAKIWDDVTVEEQVLVQSIRELRQLFSPLEIIQTHPRKGYAWVLPVEKLHLTDKPAATTPSAVRLPKNTPVILLMLIVLVALGTGVFKHYVAPEPTAKNIITVLPVDNRTEGSTLLWVRLGMMDQLIQSLQFSAGVQVFDVPYVLHLLEVSGVDAHQRVELANRIFEISGSSLVVDLSLSGSVNDYRLLYRLYTPEDQSSGVIIDGQLDNLIARMATVIAHKTDARLDLSHLENEFNSSLLAEAVEKWSQGQADAAIALLQSVIALEPESFLAYQLLIEYESHLGNWLRAAVNAKKIIAVAERGKYSKVYVFYYWLAKAEFAQGNIEQARHYLSVAQQLSAQAFDSLYQAYIASLSGDLALKMGDEKLAEGSYGLALAHQQAIACPIGEGLARMKLIELYTIQQKDALLLEQRHLLETLIERHKLPLELPVPSET